MNVKEFAENLGLKVLTGEKGLDREVSGVFTCDLLSWVMSHSGRADAWVTVHTHINIVAVALLTENSCIIIPHDIPVEQAVIDKASQEGIAILSSSMSSYDICWKAHEILADK